MTTLLTISANPSSFAGGTWNTAATAFNGGTWRFTITPSAASTTFTGGNFHALFGQAHGGLWFNDAKLEMYTTPGDALVFSQALTWSAGTAITIKINSSAKTVTISGATTGNGTFNFTQVGPYFDATQLMEVGRFGAGNFTMAGTFSNVDDAVIGGTATAPAIVWSASAKGLRAAKAQPAALAWSSAATGAKNGKFGTATAPAVVWSAAPVGIRARVQPATPAAVAWSSGASGGVNSALAVGAHGVDFQRFGFANRPWSITLTTQATGSMVVIGCGGRSAEVTQAWTDSKNAGGIRKLTASPVDYPDFAGYGTQVGVTLLPFVGGSGHAFSGPVATNDEGTEFATEVIGGARAKTLNTNVANAGAGTTATSASITTDGPAVLIADWWGSSPVVPPFTGGIGTPYTAVPNNGFSVIDSYLVNNEFGEVQAARATRVVSAAGTYSVTWTHSPAQGAQTWITAVEPARTASPTPPALTWSAAPTGKRARLSAAAAPVVTWSAASSGVKSRIGAAVAPTAAWSAAATGLRARLSAATGSAITWVASPLGARARFGAASPPVATWSATARGLRATTASAQAVAWVATARGLRDVTASPGSVAWSAAPTGIKSAPGQHPAIAPPVAWSASVIGLRAMVRAAIAPAIAWTSSASGAKNGTDPYPIYSGPARTAGVYGGPVPTEESYG